MINLDQVHGPAVDTCWATLEPLLRKGYAHGGVTMDAELVRTDARAGKCQLWVVYDSEKPLPLYAALLTRVYGDLSVIECCGGRDLDVWLLEFLRQFEALAASNGMKRVQIEGRFGWRRTLPDYRPVRIVLEKKLEEPRR